MITILFAVSVITNCILTSMLLWKKRHGKTEIGTCVVKFEADTSQLVAEIEKARRLAMQSL